jgi:hypothetical protein
MPFYVGLDLGQSTDFTALAVVEDGTRRSEGRGRPLERYLHLRHLERYPLRTLYPDIAEAVATLLLDEHLSPNEYDPSRGRYFRKAPELIVDQTGVGPAVTDILRKKGIGFKAITITGGDSVHNVGSGRYRVPKRDLVSALEVAFHTGELKVAGGMKLWPELRGELLNFRRKINLKTAHDSYEHWREGDHDDLVLACALACWWVRRRPRGSRKLRVIA